MLPVSPSTPPASVPSLEGAGGHDETGVVPLHELAEEEEIDPKEALLSEPIVGIEHVVHDHNGPGP